MRRPLTYIICVAFALLLLTPALAGATTSTADQIAQLQRAVAALQTLTAQQSQQIQALQAQVAAKHTVLNGIVVPAASLGCVGDLYVNTATSQLYGPKACGGWGTPTSLVGPKGATGVAGATGPIGPQGVKGDIGATGLAGAPGATGPMGPQGGKGDTGATGAQGAQGPQGDKGTPGKDGVVGPPGPKGDTGTTGEPGPQGAPGAAGQDGASGLAGVNGATWLTHAGVPGDKLQAKTGDLCLDTLNGDVYQKTQGDLEPGPWVLVANICGPKGDSGPAGPVGTAGQDGAAGAKGDVGPVGPAGPKGDKGDAGDASSDPAYAKWVALAPFVRVESGAIDGDPGPNIIVSNANLLTEDRAGAYALLGEPYWTRLAAPTSVVASPSIEGSGADRVYGVTVHWVAPIGVVSGFRIYRRNVSNDPDGPWVPVARCDGDIATYEDSPLPVDTQYQYAVSALDSNGDETDKCVSAPLLLVRLDHLDFSPPVATLIITTGAQSFDVTVRTVDQSNQPVWYDGALTCVVTGGQGQLVQPVVQAHDGEATFTFVPSRAGDAYLTFAVSSPYGQWTATYHLVVF